jgi:hypothetical protein
MIVERLSDLINSAHCRMAQRRALLSSIGNMPEACASREVQTRPTWSPHIAFQAVSCFHMTLTPSPGLPSGHEPQAAQFCPRCARPRTGELRFCGSCQFDFGQSDTAPVMSPLPKTTAYEASALPLPTTAETPKRGNRKRWIVAGAVVLLLAAAAASGSKSPNTAVAPLATTGAGPVAGDAAATPVALSTAGPIAGDGAVRWAAFISWVSSDFTALSEDMNAVTERATAGDVAGAMTTAKILERTSRSMLEYMDSHPAAACYQSVYRGLHDALVAYREAGTAGAGADFTEAADAMTRGTESLNAATASTTAANLACTT